MARKLRGTDSKMEEFALTELGTSNTSVKRHSHKTLKEVINDFLLTSRLSQ